MLGVLGTFLGLVDTVGGAGAVVREARSFAALRADLAVPNGVFNFFDVSAYLASYNAGCP